MKQDEQIDHCRRLNPSLSHAIFWEIAFPSVLFSRPTRLNTPGVGHSSDTQTPTAAQIPPISVVLEVIDEVALFYEREAFDQLSTDVLT
jgi:hypothetical protein